jgi:bacterioferritin (cytochrome b1)
VGYNAAVSGEEMDVDAVLEKLNRCLTLQYRSVLQQTLTSGSLFGFEFQPLGDRLWKDADAEMNDLRLLVEKIAALGGTPTTDVAELRWSGDPADAVQWLIDTESELVDALKDAIGPTGQEGRSEALEHVLEHIIMRKQNQVDFLLRARRTE